MSAITILNNIPPPAVVATAKALYPFDKIEVGQSFFVAGMKKRNMQQNCRTWSKKLKKVFVCDDYTMSEDYDHKSVDGVMVWRMPDVV